MGSIITHDIECGNCKHDTVFEDFNYKTGEFYDFCSVCGASSSASYKNRNGKKVISRKSTTPKGGAYTITYSNGMSESGTYEKRNHIFLIYKKVKLICSDFTYTYKRSGKWYIKSLKLKSLSKI